MARAADHRAALPTRFARLARPRVRARACVRCAARRSCSNENTDAWRRPRAPRRSRSRAALVGLCTFDWDDRAERALARALRRSASARSRGYAAARYALAGTTALYAGSLAVVSTASQLGLGPRARRRALEPRRGRCSSSRWRRRGASPCSRRPSRSCSSTTFRTSRRSSARGRSHRRAAAFAVAARSGSSFARIDSSCRQCSRR